MLDRNRPSFEQFNIQLWQRIKNLLAQETRILRMPVLDSPTLLDEDYKVSYPRNFRLLRSLIILHWEFPEFLFWRVHLDLSEINFKWLSEKQRILIRILLDSKEATSRYLYETRSLSGNEIFGNILGNDYKDLFKEYLKIFRKRYKLIKSVYRRGYKDKGTWVPSHQHRERFDFSFTLEQNLLEQEQIHLDRVTNRILKYLKKEI